MSAIKEAERITREIIMTLPEKQKFNAFDIAEKMGAKNRFNIGTAEAMIRRLDGVVRESDGRMWCFSPAGGVHGSWKRSDGRYVKEHYILEGN